MKAKEYMAMYYDKIIAGDATAMQNIVLGFVTDYNHLIEVRRPKSRPALYAIANEVNQKWNALAAAVEKRHGAPVLEKDGFMFLALEDNAELRRAVAFAVKRRTSNG